MGIGHDDGMATAIFHITEPALWERALLDGYYSGSTRDADLSVVGFIHCSFKHQVGMVANFVYDDWDGPLLLLDMDPDKIPSEIRVENLDGGTEGFPHLYGPLPTSAVRAAYRLVRQGSCWTLPVDL
jgi:uncharacterized protein (DUF952 family)